MINKLIYEMNFCEAFEKEYLYEEINFLEQLDKYIEGYFEICEIDVNISYPKIQNMLNKKDLDYVVYEFMPRLAVYLRLKYALNSYIDGDCLVIKL